MIGEIARCVDIIERSEVGFPCQIQSLNRFIFSLHTLPEGIAAEKMRIVVTQFIEEFIAENRIILRIAHPCLIEFPVKRNPQRMIRIKRDEMPASGSLPEIRIIRQTGNFRSFVLLPEIDFIGKETIHHRFEPGVRPQLQTLDAVLPFCQPVTGENKLRIVGADVNSEKPESPDGRFHIQLPGAGDKIGFSIPVKGIALDGYILHSGVQVMFFLARRHFNFHDEITRGENSCKREDSGRQQKMLDFSHDFISFSMWF